MIALKNVTKVYGTNMVLNNLSLTIEPGSNICIVGPSGSGKSTLARLLIRAEDPTSGIVEVDGVNIRSLPPPVLQLFRRRVGIIFQEPLLLHATVEENVMLPLELVDAPDVLRSRNTADLLSRLGLSVKAHHFPDSLSARERSLVGIARALISAPMVIIADEPFRDLDDNQVKIVSEMLINMQRKGATIISFATDSRTASALTAQALQLQNGKILQQASPQKKMETHRILEEQKTETATVAEDYQDQSPLPPPQNPQSGGRRIRITSIGSGM